MSRTLVAALLLLVPLAQAAEPPDDEAVVGRTISLTLSRAIELALRNNLDLHVARTGPRVAREVLEQARGAFDPLAFGEYLRDHAETPVASGLQDPTGGLAVVDEDEWNYTAGFGGILPLGLSYSSTYNFGRLRTTSAINDLDPEYRAFIASEVTLPLLKDLIHNEANVNVKRSRIARQISEEDFRQFLIDLTAGVEAAYWELAASRARAGVADKSLKTAQDLLEQTRLQYEVGVVARVLVTQAEAGVAEREVNAILEHNFEELAQDNLLETIAAPDPEGYATTRLVPEDPTYIEYLVNEGVSISKAMRHRPELAAARRQVEDARIQLAFARNQRLPRLDLIASYATNGLSGEVEPTNLLGAPLTQGSVPKNGRDAHQDLFRGGGARSWAVGGRFEIPIGNRTARHLVTQREIELRRTRTQLRRVEQSVILDVRRAARNMRSATEALEAAERRRIAQEETLRAEEERLRLGDSTPFEVLEFEEDLAEAERQQILALQSYRNAIAGLERAQGTILETRSISLENELRR
jgi:outer membrane protein TolC